MTKQQAISIISKCVKLYDKNLVGKQVAFVYLDENNRPHFTEVLFRTYHFLHFTGVNPRPGLNANDFYRRAQNSRLTENDFSFKSNNTTERKLQILDVIMCIDTRARMIGNYMGPNLQLHTEKVTGTTSACLGLILKNNIYLPNSVLKEDIRTIVSKPPGKIFAIFKKDFRSKQYTILTYKSKPIRLTSNCLPRQLIPLIDPSLFQYNSSDTGIIQSNPQKI